jgi:hypothetical protein
LSSRCSKRLLVVLLGVALGPLGCASSPAQRAAERGDQALLHEAIAAREERGDLSNGDAANLARTVAERDLRNATGADAVDRVRDSRACAHELDRALAARMKTRDAAGALAAIARIDGGGLRAEDARGTSTDGDPSWRAVVARSLVRPEDGDARRQALVDPEPLVRREAARAARDTRDVADVTALAEAARLDPEPLVRTEAVRALAATSRVGEALRGASRDALRDLWDSADEGLREDIALAWSQGPSWEMGGRDVLRLLVSSQHGPAAVEGAVGVLRRTDADADVVQAALGQLERAIASGPRGLRLQAIARAPLDRAELLEVVKTAADSDDLDVRVGALARLAEAKVARPMPPVEELEGLARPGSRVAPRARFALAMAGDRRAQAWIEQDLDAGPPEQRLAAATELAAMGVSARGAPLLAHADAGVRLRAACTMIMAVRGR